MRTVDYTRRNARVLLVFAVLNFGHFVKFHFTLRSFTIINNLYYTLTTFLPSLCLSTEIIYTSILYLCVCVCVNVANVFCVLSEYILRIREHDSKRCDAVHVYVIHTRTRKVV